MENRENSLRKEQYICFSCLRNSTEQDRCSNCGAEIGDFNIENAVLEVPKYGKFVVVFAQFPEFKIREAIAYATNNYFQSFSVVVGNSFLEVSANEIAFGKFIEALSRVQGVAIEYVQERVHFEVIPNTP